MLHAVWIITLSTEATHFKVNFVQNNGHAVSRRFTPLGCPSLRMVPFPPFLASFVGSLCFVPCYPQWPIRLLRRSTCRSLDCVTSMHVQIYYRRLKGDPPGLDPSCIQRKK